MRRVLPTQNYPFKLFAATDSTYFAGTTSEFNPGTDGTVWARCMMTDLQTLAAPVMAKWDGSTGRDWLLDTQAKGIIAWNTLIGIGGAGVGTTQSGPLLQFGRTFCTAGYISGGSIKCYMRGAQIGTGAVGGTINTGGPVFRGGGRADTNQSFTGVLIECAHWSVALTLDELHALEFHGKKPYEIRPSSLVEWYQFADGNVKGFKNGLSLTRTGNHRYVQQPDTISRPVALRSSPSLIKYLASVAQASILKVDGVANASIKKVATVQNV